MTHESKDYIKALRNKGYRVTPQRLIVLDAVCAYQGHATFADIQSAVYDMDSSINRSTIYRALAVLREVGLVIETEIENTGKVYCIAGSSDHAHLVCLSCAQVITVPEHEMMTIVEYFRDRYGFEMQSEHIIFNGFCKNCYLPI